MLEFISTFNKVVDDFFEQHKMEIYSATALILLVDVMIALPFVKDYLQTGMARNFMVFGGAFHQASFGQFAWLGTQWLAFADMFIFLPAIVWSMLMPSIVAYFKKMMAQEE